MNRDEVSVPSVRQAWRISADLIAVISLVVVANLAVLLPALDESVGQVVVGLAFVFFAPGYALVSALFPEAGRPPAASVSGTADSRMGRFFASGRERLPGEIDAVERGALAFALSIAVVPLLAIALSVTPVEFSLRSILLLISVVTVLCSVVAAIRRWRLPADRRFRVSPRQWVATGAGFVTGTDSRFSAVLNVGLAVAILFAVGSVSFAVAAPPEGEQFTDFYVLTENDGGELVEAGYPANLTVGDSEPVVVRIDNQEHDATDYTVVIELHRVQNPQQGNATNAPVEEATLREFHTQIGHNETWTQTYPIEPTMTGENLRLTFLLYKGDSPADPTVANAYRELHLWVSVDGPN
ncbi:DUF1616 domain-containing protein [Haloarcula marina]|uniref:DUF1616 domain-containing protein n=1 Tax=Haloarcula marina TaxID=2961574 RepID=UPI0020B68E4C|nr:DUF1616 domain-containing protein [Halomicroarcula marina]